MGVVYSIANQKGGVGKTTTAVNLATACAATGLRVLLVDLDQQCNATVSLGGSRESRPSSYDCLSGTHTILEAARSAGPENVWLVPASRDLAGASVELPSLEGYQFRLSKQLGAVRDRFDLIIFDCPPSLGPVTINALVASDKVLIPVQAEYLALEGLVQFLETLRGVRNGLNSALETAGIIVTMHDERTRLAQDVEAELRSHFPDLVFDTVIPRSVRIAEAPSFGVPVIEHAPGSRGAAAHVALASELIARETEISSNPKVMVES